MEKDKLKNDMKLINKKTEREEKSQQKKSKKESKLKELNSIKRII